MRTILFIVVLCFSIPMPVLSQAIDNNLSYRNFSSEKYIRLYYENDYFAASDLYYTQGIHFELVAPWLKKNLFAKLLVHPKTAEIIYGIAMEHNAYTPSSILSDSILRGDRPFAAVLLLKTFLIANNEKMKERFSSAITTGIIGRTTGGYEMQSGIHHLTKDPQPHGWQYQIQNDVVLNYQLDFEKALLQADNYFLLNSYSMLRAGTLSDKLSAGCTIITGYFNSPFAIADKKFSIYFYEHPQINFVGYDATLQGGFFTNSRYTINAASINRVVFENRIGAVLIYKSFYVEYFQQYITKEFETGRYHRTGGVQIGLKL